MAVANRARKEAAQAHAAPEVEAQVRALLQRAYRMVVQGDLEEGYLAYVPELPGCMTAGETPAEAMELLRDAMASWLAAAVEDQQAIPEPLPPASPVEEWRQHSGRFLFRMPRSIHRALAERASAEGTTINQLILAYVSRGLGPTT